MFYSLEEAIIERVHSTPDTTTINLTIDSLDILLKDIQYSLPIQLNKKHIKIMVNDTTKCRIIIDIDRPHESDHLPCNELA